MITFVWLLASVAAVHAVQGASEVEWSIAPNTAEGALLPWPSPPRKTVLRPFAAFLENRGQWPETLRFLGRASGALIRVEQDALVLQLADPAGDTNVGVIARFEFPSANGVLDPKGELVLPGVHHYLIGKDPSKWTRNVQGFTRVRYACVADGIDLVLRDEDGKLEYDLDVNAGADLSALVFACQGVEHLELAADGTLLVHTALGTLEQTPPRSEELLPNGVRRSIDVRFRIVDQTHFGFESPQRNPDLELRIDPVLIWSTYLGSSGSLGGFESCTASAVDVVSGCVTLTGWTNGFDFPTTPGAYVATPPGGSPVFVTKLDSTGNLVYSSTIGGHSGGAQGLALALDALGRATVGGSLNISPLFTSDFPTTPGALDQVMSSANTSGFALRLSELGDTLVFSTFIEGAGSGTKVYALDVAASGATLVGGFTGSAVFPVTSGAFDTTLSIPDAFVLRLDPTGSFLEWSTFLGGSGADETTAVKVGPTGEVTVVGFTSSQNFPFSPGAFNHTVVAGGSFVARLNAQGTALLWATFLGGTSPAGSNVSTPNAIALEPGGGVVVVGTTLDETFPTTPGALFTAYPIGSTTHSYVARVNATGTSLTYSTLLSFAAVAKDVVVDASGVATVSGIDLNTTMPTTPGAYDSTQTYLVDGFITRINPTGTKMYYSTKFGGPNSDNAQTIAAVGPHRMAFAGAMGIGAPTTPGSFDQTFNGGNNDIVAAVLDLFLRGTRGYGRSTPSCRSELIMNVTQMPSAGAVGFGFWCSGAPPLAQGWLLLGYEAPTPAPGHGAAIWLDLSRRIFPIAVQTNVDGFVETALPLTAIPIGAHFAAQYVFLNTATCTGLGPFSASHVVLVDVQ